MALSRSTTVAPPRLEPESLPQLFQWRRGTCSAPPESRMYQVEHLAPAQIRPNPHNARTHSKRQISQIAASISKLGFAAPVLVDETYELIAGHGRLEAAKSLGLSTVPAVIIGNLSSAKKRALALADNKIADSAGWDRQRLAVELPVLAELLIEEDLDISLTGFEAYEIDAIAEDLDEPKRDPDDETDETWAQQRVVAQLGDLWQLGWHRLVCGSALADENLRRLMGGERARVAFLDPPYNVRISGIVGRGRIQHTEFAMGSGEMTDAEFREFLEQSLKQAASVSVDGAVHFVCIDWRHVADLMQAGRQAYGEALNLVVWAKTNAGQGSFYRSQHELIGVFRVGQGRHVNNVELGRHGRNRSNVWRYAGVNTFRQGRLDELAVHPTVKPVVMIADALKDCSKRGDIVLDTFSGSGSTILAAEKVGRRGFGIEIEPRYVDVAIRRWQKMTGRDATLADDGTCFDDVDDSIRTAEGRAA